MDGRTHPIHDDTHFINSTNGGTIITHKHTNRRRGNNDDISEKNIK